MHEDDKKGLTGDEKIIEQALEDFKNVSEWDDDNRTNYTDDTKFAHGEQWPDDIKADRDRKKRPCLVDNRLPVFISQIVNDGRQNSPTIQIHPIDDKSDPKTASTYEGIIRQIEAVSNADQAYDTALEHAATGGFGYFRVLTELADDDTFNQDIKIKRVPNPLTIYMDHHAKEYDKSDAKFAFVTEWIPIKQFHKEWPGAEEASWDDMSSDHRVEWANEKQIRIAEYWVRKPIQKEICLLIDGRVIDKTKIEEEFEGLLPKEIEVLIQDTRTVESFEVKRYLMTGIKILEKSDWAGKYIPIVPVYGPETYIDGKPVYRSAIRNAKDPQRLHNYWQSSITEKIALQPKVPYVGPASAFEGFENQWGAANSSDSAYLPYNDEAKVPPQRQQPAIMNIAEIQQSAQSIEAIKATIGMFGASLGERTNEQSGTAIQARQREGDNATFAFHDNLARSIGHVARILIDLIPKIYDAERQVRILGVDGKDDFVPINQKIKDPGSGEEVMINDLSAGKYDYTVSTGPSYATQRLEALDAMVRMTEANPSLWGIIGDKIISNMDFPDAEATAKRIRATIPKEILDAEKQEEDAPEPEQQPTPEQLAAEKTAEAEMAKAEATMATAEANMAKAEATMAEAQAKMMEIQELGDLEEKVEDLVAKAVAEYEREKNQAA